METDPRGVLGRVEDVDLVEQMLARIATPEEAAAARRLLGVEQEAARLAAAYAPPSPSPANTFPDVDALAVARAAVDRYQAWVDSYPDDEDVPLRVRDRALRTAVAALHRLETP